MAADPALDLLYADARRQGLTVKQYEARYGILLDERRLASYETPMSTLRRGWQRHAVAIIGHESAPTDVAGALDCERD
jgi:hypothetical protein